MVEHTRSRPRIGRLLPVIADGLSFLAALAWLPVLSLSLNEPSGWNALLLVLFYILFCSGVYLIRKLEPDREIRGWSPPKILLEPKVRGVLAFLFGLLMMTTVAYQLGYFASIQSIRTAGLDEGGSSALFVYMPGALLGFSMFYILVLAFPVQENVAPRGWRSAILIMLGLIFINSMLLFSSAQARAVVGEMGLAGSIWTWLGALAVLIISFAPPRILFQSKFPDKSGALSFALLLLTASWWIAS